MPISTLHLWHTLHLQTFLQSNLTRNWSNQCLIMFQGTTELAELCQSWSGSKKTCTSAGRIDKSPHFLDLAAIISPYQKFLMHLVGTITRSTWYTAKTQTLSKLPIINLSTIPASPESGRTIGFDHDSFPRTLEITHTRESIVVLR